MTQSRSYNTRTPGLTQQLAPHSNKTHSVTQSQHRHTLISPFLEMMYCMFSNELEKTIVAQLVKKIPTNYRILNVPLHAHSSFLLYSVTNRTHLTSLACTLIFLQNVTSRQPNNNISLCYRIDLKNQDFVFEFFFPNIEVHCRYNVSGQVLILPITGNGDGVLVFSK